MPRELNVTNDYLPTVYLVLFITLCNSRGPSKWTYELLTPINYNKKVLGS